MLLFIFKQYALTITILRKKKRFYWKEWELKHIVLPIWRANINILSHPNLVLSLAFFLSLFPSNKMLSFENLLERSRWHLPTTQTNPERHLQAADQWESTGRAAQSSLGFVSRMGQTGWSIFRKLSQPQGTPLGTALPSVRCGDSWGEEISLGSSQRHQDPPPPEIEMREQSNSNIHSKWIFAS